MKSWPSYTVDHFAHEEKLFDQDSFPERAEHKNSTRTTSIQYKKIQADSNAERAGVSMELMQFLTTRPKDHMVKDDGANSPFLKQHSVK